MRTDFFKTQMVPSSPDQGAASRFGVHQIHRTSVPELMLTFCSAHTKHVLEIVFLEMLLKYNTDYYYTYILFDGPNPSHSVYSSLFFPIALTAI